MTPPKEFTKRLIALKLTLEPNKPPLPDAVVRSYWEILSEYPMEAIAKALNVIARSSTWFPKPVEILDQIKGGSPEELAEKAVGELERAMGEVGPYNSIIFSDRAMTAAIHGLGGWETVCNWTEDEWPFRIKEFKTLYASYVRRGVPNTIPNRLSGIHERKGGVVLGQGRMVPAGELASFWGDHEECLRLSASKDRSGEVIAKLSEAIGGPDGEVEAPWEGESEWE